MVDDFLFQLPVMHALSVDNISFSYRAGTPILNNVSFHLKKGEFLSIVGPNGSGKTTLLRLLDRIYPPQRGNIFLGERALTSYPRGEIAKRIAFVAQDNLPYFPFTVREIVLMGRSPYIRGLSFENSHDREVAVAAMKQTDVEHLANHPITALSGGERQRVFIARALAQEPEIILLDEPNAHLDIAHLVDVFTIITRLNKQSGVTVVSVSHDLNLAAAYSDRVGMLVCGSLVALGTPEEVLTEASIKEVFRTDVLVDRHPMANKPRVTLATS